MRLDEIPAAFRALHALGRLDYWGAPYASLTDEQRDARLRSHQTEVLWWSVIEWDRSPEEVVLGAADDGLRPGLVPFAGNGYGDQYCWYPPWQQGPEPPVIFQVHDETDSPLFAEDFAGCLFRCLLQHFAGAEEPDDERAQPREVLWRAHREIVAPFIGGHLARLNALGDDPSPQACAAADEDFVNSLPRRSLIGSLLPTTYAEEHFKDSAVLLRAYDESVAFYEDLVTHEGRVEFTPQLAEARANRDRVARGQA